MVLKLKMNTKSMLDQPKLFPKLFIGDAVKAFKAFLKSRKYEYSINEFSSRDDLLSFIYKCKKINDNRLIILSDISLLTLNDQKHIVELITKTNIKLILLASNDNILDELLMQIKAFRKYYTNITDNSVNYIDISKARDLFNKEKLSNNYSTNELNLLYNKYNPILAYNNDKVKLYSKSEQDKLLYLLEH